MGKRKKHSKGLDRLLLPFDIGCLGCGCLPGTTVLLITSIGIIGKFFYISGGFDLVSKQELRKELKSQLKNIDNTTYEEWSSKIAMTVLETEEWKSARVIGITLSMKREVDTIRLIERAWSEGKTVCVPKCEPINKSMNFYKITSFDQLEVVYYSLKEPIVERTQKIPKQEIELLFVPGLAFTKSGYRLGQGGGYYDRYLIDFQGKTISLAFSIAIVDELPIEPFDIPVQKIITNSEIINCHG